MYDKGLVSMIYKEPQNSAVQQKKIHKLVRVQAKEVKTYLMKMYRWQISTREKLNIISHTEIQIKATVRYHYTPLEQLK